jgi:Cu/Ag efflux pump CusA
VVLALLILIVGPLAALRTPTDIFPDIRIPVIAVVFQYTGLPPDPMSGRIVTPFERALTTTVNNIEHIEATSYTGFGIVKIFFQPTVDIDTCFPRCGAYSLVRPTAASAVIRWLCRSSNIRLGQCRPERADLR